MGRKVDVYIVGAVNAADKHVVIIYALGMLLGNEALYLGNVHALVYAGHYAFVNDGVGGKLILIFGDEAPVKQDKLKHVASLHE